MKKRILYVVTKSNFGGAQRYVYELATGLPKNEFEVGVAFGGTGLLKQKLEEAGVRTFPIPGFERDINLVKEVRAMFELRDIISAFRPDIVHLNSSKAGGSGAFIARLMGVRRIIFTAHGWPFMERRSPLWRAAVWFFSWLTALLSHTVILVSAPDRTHTHMPFVSKKLVVIPTAVAPFEPLPRVDARHKLEPEKDTSASELWVGTIAELTPNKNLECAIRAVATYNRTHDRKLRYIILGAGELETRLNALVHELGTEEHITLAGYVDNARIYLSAFDLFILPSKKEGMPYAILEAGYLGLPVIASNVGGIPEIIEDGESGLLIEPTEDGILNALEQLCNEADLRTQLGSALETRITNSFGLQSMLEQTRARYISS